MKTNEYDVIIVSCIGHMFYVISTLHHTLIMCASLIQGGGGGGGRVVVVLVYLWKSLDLCSFCLCI